MSGPSRAARALLRPALLHAALPVLAAVLVASPTLRNGFVFDDHMLLRGNGPVLSGEAPLSSAFTYRYWGAADEASPNELYRPITIVSLALNARMLGLGPAGMHAVNIGLHALNALLAWLLIRSLFGRPRLALLASLLFAAHPIATEAVAPVAGRADLLAACFLLSGSLLALRAARRRGLWILAGGLGAAAAAFAGGLSKETVFAAPLVTLAVLGADARRHSGDARSDRDYRLTGATLAGIQVFALCMVLVLRAAILGYLFQSEPPANPSTAYLAFVNNPIQFAEPLPRVLTALRTAVMGAGLMVFPYHLSADYSFNEIPVAGAALSAGDVAAPLFALIYLGLVFWTAHRFPVVLFALCWSALTYLLVSNLLFPIGTIFGERLLYIPSLGFALLLAAGLDRLVRAGGARRRAAAWGLAAVLLALYGGRFAARCADWRDDDRLFAATVRTSPASAKAHSNRGFTLQRSGRCEEAIVSYRQALSIAPGLTGSGVSLARCLMTLGRPGDAIEQYRQVLARDDSISFAWSGLGAAELAQGRHTEAEGSFRKALGLSMGGNREAARGLAEILARTGREQEAVHILEKIWSATGGADDLRLPLGESHYLLGLRELAEGRKDRFVEAMARAVAIVPEHGAARYNLALDALREGRMEEARGHARAGLRAGYAFPQGFLETVGLEREAAGDPGGGAPAGSAGREEQEPGSPGS